MNQDENRTINCSSNEESGKHDSLDKDFSQAKKSGLYSEPAFADSNDSISLGEVNKYYNLGFSENSQELIGEFYQNLVTQDSLKSKSFEEILYSIIEDIQVYKKDIRRLEQSLKNEKEYYEDVLRQMIEEADHQLAESGDRIRNEERENCEKTIAKMKEHFETETSVLQETLARMKKMEKKYLSDKDAEGLIISDLNEEVKSLRKENQSLKSLLDESNFQISKLKRELSKMTQVKEDSELIIRNFIAEPHREIHDLQDEIKALCETNKKLIDANDLLREKIERLKLKNKILDEPSSEDSLKLVEMKRQLPNKINQTVCSINRHDKEIGLDLGYFASNEFPYALVGQGSSPNMLMASMLQVSIMNGFNERLAQVPSQLDSIEQMQADELAKMSKLSSEIQTLVKQNQELKELFNECRNTNKRSRNHSADKSPRSVPAEIEKLNQQETEKPTKKKRVQDLRAIQKTYKKLNDINELLKDEIEHIKMKASKICQKDS